MTSADGLPTIKTFSGVVFNYADPTPDMIRIEDIAHGLSNLCRFAGQSQEFYSVAQHSVLVMELALGHSLWGLLHDASEAYCGDMVRPLKKLMPQYRDVEDRVMEAIAAKFDLPLPMPSEVKKADNIALAIEGKNFMKGRDEEYGVSCLSVEQREIVLESLPPKVAEEKFLVQFYLLEGSKKCTPNS